MYLHIIFPRKTWGDKKSLGGGCRNTCCRKAVFCISTHFISFLRCTLFAHGTRTTFLCVRMLLYDLAL